MQWVLLNMLSLHSNITTWAAPPEPNIGHLSCSPRLSSPGNMLNVVMRRQQGSMKGEKLFPCDTFIKVQSWTQMWKVKSVKCIKLWATWWIGHFCKFTHSSCLHDYKYFPCDVASKWFLQLDLVRVTPTDNDGANRLRYTYACTISLIYSLISPSL